jgi:polysaccharide export outer membrane protein
VGQIRIDDVVSVQVAGELSLSGPQRVTSDGTVTLPLAGVVKVAGMMPDDAARSIAAILKKKELLRHPEVVLTIVARPEKTIFVAGAVEKQGRSILSDNAHLDEYLEPAGILPTSDLSKVVITRGDQKIVVDYQAYRTGNDTPDGANNPLLQNGDKIYVRARVQVAGTIKVNGEVKSPLTTGLTTGLTVVQAVQQAGGVTDTADRDQILVLREGKEIIVPLKQIQEGQTSKDIVLQDKDEVFVRRLEKPKMFVVNGGVAHSSAFPLVGKVTLSDAIALAGGALQRVDLKKVTLQRKNEAGEIAMTTYDLTKPAQASLLIQNEDVIGVPHPSQPKQGVMGALQSVGSLTSLLFLFMRR